MRWAGRVAHMEEKNSTYRVSLGKLDVKKPFGRHGHKG